MNHKFRNFRPGFLTPEAANQLNLLARYTEKLMNVSAVHPLKVGRENGHQFTFDHFLGDMVRVTSTTTTNGRYPGRLLIHDASSDTYSDGDIIWVTEINGSALTAQRYLAHETDFVNGRRCFVTRDKVGVNYNIQYPDALTGDEDDYDPGAGDFFIISQGASYFINGIDITNTSTVIVIFNNSTCVLKIGHEKGTSTAEYRIKTPTATDLYIPPYRGVMLWYDADVDERWKVSTDSKDGYYAPELDTFTGGTTGDSVHTLVKLDVTTQDVGIASLDQTCPWLYGGLKRIYVDKDSTYGVRLDHESGSSNTYQISTLSGANMSIPPGGYVDVLHDGTTYVVVGHSQCVGYFPNEVATGTTENNLAIGNCPTVTLAPSGSSSTITGMVATGGNLVGTRRTISAIGDVTLTDSDSSSSTNNRIRTNGADLVMAGGAAILECIDYFGATHRVDWTPIATYRCFHAPVEAAFSGLAGTPNDSLMTNGDDVQAAIHGFAYITTSPLDNIIDGIEGGINGGKFTLINDQSTAVTINDSATVTATKQIVCPGGVDFDCPDGYTVQFHYYDDKWRVVGGTAYAKYVLDQIPTDPEIQEAASSLNPAFKCTTTGVGTPCALSASYDTESMLSSNEIVFDADTAGKWHFDFHFYGTDGAGTFDRLLIRIQRNPGAGWTDLLAQSILIPYTVTGTSVAGGNVSIDEDLASGDKVRVTASVTNASGTPTYTGTFTGHMIRKA